MALKRLRVAQDVLILVRVKQIECELWIMLMLVELPQCKNRNIM